MSRDMKDRLNRAHQLPFDIGDKTLLHFLVRECMGVQPRH